jgi:hypothetical protein
MLDLEIAAIESSVERPRQTFRILGGLLEKIIDDKKHAARPALIWQNGFYGKSSRKMIKALSYFHATNAPLMLHSKILDEVLEYVFLPREVVAAYRRKLTNT